MLILIGIAIGIILTVSAMKYINLYGYPSLPQILLFAAIAIGILLSLLYIGFLLIFSQLDPMRFRLTKQCANCVFTFTNADFSGGEFEGANLSNSNIASANFRNANLKKANLSSMRNSGGDRPDFQGANLRESNLTQGERILLNTVHQW
jgi:Pentapeptide repeats (8 copies)